MSRLGSPEGEPIEQSVVSPDALRRVVGSLHNIDQIEAIMRMDPDSSGFLLKSLTKDSISFNLSTLGRNPRS